ncbi:hypothetical protein RF11_03870 [Thelohanellus kitauei]|uniref:Uncharacterized protein n=1 Tax=Thelohanellus kitauei TaxID=669202 RepID=A0A0C2IGL4_THEKT|nr:hypothetical protein RF11_03870 [Thelohanellus kitauei]
MQEIKSAIHRIFNIQIDESIDVANRLQLLVYVSYRKYLWHQMYLKIFVPFKKLRNIFWENIDVVGTDGSQIIPGYRSGFPCLVENESSKLIGIHSMIRGQI